MGAGAISLPWPQWRQRNFPKDIGVPEESTLAHLNNLPQNSVDAAPCKPGGPRNPDFFTMLRNGMSSVLMDPDL